MKLEFECPVCEEAVSAEGNLKNRGSSAWCKSCSSRFYVRASVTAVDKQPKFESATNKRIRVHSKHSASIICQETGETILKVDHPLYNFRKYHAEIV